MRWRRFTDRIGCEVRLGTLPQPADVSLTAPSMSVALPCLNQWPNGQQAAECRCRCPTIWGETVSQACRPGRHRSARSMACAGKKVGFATFAAGRQNALKKRRFSTQLNFVSLRVFLDFAN